MSVITKIYALSVTRKSVSGSRWGADLANRGEGRTILYSRGHQRTRRFFLRGLSNSVDEVTFSGGQDEWRRVDGEYTRAGSRSRPR